MWQKHGKLRLFFYYLHLTVETFHSVSGFLWKTSMNLFVKQGQNITLTCPLSLNSSVGVISWYKQAPGHGPQFILSHNLTNTSHVHYGSELNNSRYAIFTSDGLKTHYHLQIITTLENDTGVYYCGFAYKNETHNWIHVLDSNKLFSYWVLDHKLIFWVFFLINTVGAVVYSAMWKLIIVKIFLAYIVKPQNFGLIGLVISQEVCAEAQAVLW